jgi:hypothetical protein
VDDAGLPEDLDDVGADAADDIGGLLDVSSLLGEERPLLLLIRIQVKCVVR